MASHRIKTVGGFTSLPKVARGEVGWRPRPELNRARPQSND
jgi:hypothetical protein